jgi:cytochrome c-type biogenesis protein CcmE
LRAVPVDKLRVADSTPQSMVSQRLRVVGFVGKKPVHKTELKTANGTVNVAHFQIEDKGKVLNIEYRDALPDTFRAGGPVQVDGVYVAEGRMEAEHVLTKCPSKYEQGEGAEGEGYAPGDVTKKDAAKAVAKDVAANTKAPTTVASS